MSLHLELFKDLDLMVLRVDGTLNEQDLRGSLDARKAQPFYHAGIRVLIDASCMDGDEIGLSDMIERRQHLSDHLQGLQTPARWGYFAPSEIAFGLCRRAQLIFADLETLQIGVFRTAPEVRQFLGLAPDAPPGWPKRA